MAHLEIVGEGRGEGKGGAEWEKERKKEFRNNGREGGRGRRREREGLLSGGGACAQATHMWTMKNALPSL